MFAYDSVFDLALGDSPFFPEKEALPVCDADTGPIAVDEGKNYFIKFYSGDIPGFFEMAPFYKRQFHGVSGNWVSIILSGFPGSGPCTSIFKTGKFQAAFTQPCSMNWQTNMRPWYSVSAPRLPSTIQNQAQAGTRRSSNTFF
jgi:hypothetical protein